MIVMRREITFGIVGVFFVINALLTVLKFQAHMIGKKRGGSF